MVGVCLSSKLSTPSNSDPPSDLYGMLWPYIISCPAFTGDHKTHIHPSSLFDVDLDMGLSGPTSSTADFAHSVDLTGASLTSAMAQRRIMSTYLLVLGVLGLVGDSGIESEEKTDTVCLDL